MCSSCVLGFLPAESWREDLTNRKWCNLHCDPGSVISLLPDVGEMDPGLHFPHKSMEKSSLGSFLGRSKSVLRHLGQNYERVDNRALRKAVKWWQKPRLWNLIKEGQVGAWEEIAGNPASKIPGGTEGWSRKVWEQEFIGEKRVTCKALRGTGRSPHCLWMSLTCHLERNSYSLAQLSDYTVTPSIGLWIWVSF